MLQGLLGSTGISFKLEDTCISLDGIVPFQSSFPTKPFWIGNKILLQLYYRNHIQSWTFAYVRLLNKPYVNGVSLREQTQH